MTVCFSLYPLDIGGEEHTDAHQYDQVPVRVHVHVYVCACASVDRDVTGMLTGEEGLNLASHELLWNVAVHTKTPRPAHQSPRANHKLRLQLDTTVNPSPQRKRGTS